MARPKVPLIHKDEVIAAALRIIDDEGLDALSVRRLGLELGVNSASLYHHFADKAEILDGVRALVFAGVGAVRGAVSWEEWVTSSARLYRRALLDHPNVAPLMVHRTPRAFDRSIYESAIKVLLEAGVPARFVYPLLDSLETLGFGSVLLEPAPHDDSVASVDDGQYPFLARALEADGRTADERFELGLTALVAGWQLHVQAERDAHRAGAQPLPRSASQARRTPPAEDGTRARPCNTNQ